MLMMLFQVGENRYAIPAENVIRVLPKVSLKSLLNAPFYVAGALNFGGVPIVVVDFCQIIEKRPSANSLHTRIFMIKIRSSKSAKEFTFGLMAERVLQTLQIDKSQFLDSSIRIEGATFLGGIVTDELGIIQLVIIEKLFDQIKEGMFVDDFKLS
jgi:chemotaxis-related protein WspB